LTAGSASRSFLHASRPPAEAPIATIGKPARALMEGSGIQRGRFAPTVCWRLPGILRLFSKSNAPRNGQIAIAEFGSDYELFRRRVLSVSVNASSGHA
jgi:hypothetical protein